MLLRDLEALEAAYDARGYRVAYQDVEAKSAAGELVPDDERGWPTAEEAAQMAARLRRVAGGRLVNIHVVGPNGAAVKQFDDDTYSQTATTLAPSTPPFGDETPAAATTAQPSAAPADAIPVAMGVPLGPVTVLAQREEGGGPSESVLVGDGGGQVYCCFRGEVEARANVRWRAKQTTFESVNITPDRTLDFHDLYWPASGGGGLAARVAFWGGEGDHGSGLWWVLRRSA